MPITSAVAILFSCFDWGTGWSQSLAIGRACGPLVTKTWVGAVLALKRYESQERKVPPGNGLLLLALAIIACLYKSWMRDQLGK